jgi:hypothetical protein
MLVFFELCRRVDLWWIPTFPSQDGCSTFPRNVGTYLQFVALGGLVIIMLAIWLKVRGFKPGRGRRILTATEIRSTTSFGGQVKPSVPWGKILQHFNKTYGYENRYFVGKIHGHLSQCSSCFATRYLCWSLSESSGSWIRNDQNSSGDAQQIRSGRDTWDALRDTTP